MSTTTPPNTQPPANEPQSFAETAMRLSGKSEEEARRLGAVDRADEQVEKLFAPQYQTVNSPVHRAVWDGNVPLALFAPPPLPESASCDRAMEQALTILRRHHSGGTLYDERGKVAESVLGELGQVGYWGMLIEEKHGGQGASFARFARFLTRVATIDPMTAGLSSVHGCIGAVDPVRSFGTPEQKAQFLPRLASGAALSGFALTEPCAGSDLTALRTQAVRVPGGFEVSGEKLFITNAIPGRALGLVVVLEGKPAVLIVELPPEENEQFQIVRYGLHALRHAYNHGLRFNRLFVPEQNLLKPVQGDGLTIAYHGLNLGRVALCASAAGSMRVLLANMLPWAAFRKTYGAAIDTRELVRRRLARLAALIAGADALVEWCSWLIDQGYRGELECVVAKIFGSEALKEASIELFMKTHGGRSFLHGHLFGDNVHDYLAPCIYEGEGEMLGMAFFKSLVKQHGKDYFEPIAQALKRHGLKTLQPWHPVQLWQLRQELGRYAGWMLKRSVLFRDRQRVPGIEPRFQRHVNFALDHFQDQPEEISATLRKHQLKLADRQCRMAELSQRIQDNVVLLVTALWGARQKSEVSRNAADLLCHDLRRKLIGYRPNDRHLKAAVQLGEQLVQGGFAELASIEPQEILMKYEG